MKRAVFRVGIIATLALCGGCYSQGNSHFLSLGENEYFLTMGHCEKEAMARRSDGSAKYSGYECRKKFLWFTTEKRDFQEGKLISN